MTKAMDQVMIRFGCVEEARFYAKTYDIKTIISINQYNYVGIGEKCIFLFDDMRITAYYKQHITAGDYIPENRVLLAVKEGFPSFCFFSNNDYENLYLTDVETMDSCIHTLKYLHYNNQEENCINQLQIHKTQCLFFAGFLRQAQHLIGL